MARKRSKYPTELELEILKVLWQRSSLLVREVREELARQGRKLAHTTLITTLNVMHGKGFAKRDTSTGGRGYAFSPKVSREEVSRGMIGDLVDRVFEGSTSALMLSLLENDQLDSASHAELRKLIARYRREEEK